MPKRESMKSIIKSIINSIEILIILLIFILFYLIQPVKTKRIIYIPNGTINYTIKKLQKSGYDILKFDKYILYLIGKPQSGWIDMKKTKMSKFDFLYKLTTSKAALKKVTIIPGETDYFIYREIAKKMGYKNLNCSNIPYSFLYPNTYYLPYGFSTQETCNYLYKVSLYKHKNLSKRIFGYWNFTKYYQYLIIASIIQKEAKNRKDMKLISSVIYNRLKKRMKLQMDGTLNHDKYSHTKVTPKMIRNDKTRFNTYKYYGLPLKPICVVSISAIIASIFPAKTDYLYFVRVKGKHIFTKSYTEHLKSVKK
jgi:UPF0755 protein